ncbi:protein kinase X [Pancytospora philotis]|nr:protein kinase X [Pancytospora philotis]
MLSYRDFEFLRIIGSGAFGKVFLARYVNNDKLYAIKRMNKQFLKANRQLDNIYNESQILQEACFCPFIVKFLHTIETDEYIFIIMEYVRGGELFYYIKKYQCFAEDVARFFAAEIIIALKYLHDKDILYRDLKPENILINADGHIKLADFGFATKVNENVYTICGTPEYMAPEKLLGNGDTKETDYWSLGCLVFEMLCGQPPFYDTATGQIYMRVLNEALAIPREIAGDARDLLEKLLIKEREKRLGANGIEEIMQHPFFSTIDWKKLQRFEVPAPLVPKLSHFEHPSESAPNYEAPYSAQPTHTYRRIYKRVDEVSR